MNDVKNGRDQDGVSEMSETQSDQLINSEDEQPLVDVRVNSSSPPKNCPYHSFTRSTIDHNSPAPDNNRFDFQTLAEQNVSYHLMFNKDAFSKQSLLYQSHHKKFLFTRPKVGDRADRVYSYYTNNDDWRKDKYLHTSQEADNKSLKSREGRKLNLSAYHKKMQLKPRAK